MSDPFFGLELTFYAHKSSLKCPEDAAVIFVHWALASSGLQAEQSAESGANQPATSELLPASWNKDRGVYEVTYVGRDRTRYLLKALVVEGQLIVNMSKIDSDTTAVFNKLVSEMVNQEKYAEFASAYSDVKSLKEELTRGLVEALTPGLRSQRTADAARTPSVTSPSDDPQRSSLHDPLRVPHIGRPDQPLAVGGADLDPLGRGFGGGMIMDPRRPPVASMPPGVPPGARFDPFSPPGVGPRPGPPGSRPRVPGEPNPDHLQPPDYDHMFM